VEPWKIRQSLLLASAFLFTSGYSSVGIVLLIGTTVWELIRGAPLWQRSSIDRSLAVLLGVTFLSGLASEWPSKALEATAEFAVGSYVVVRAVALSSGRWKEFGPRFLTAWGIGGAVAGVLAIISVRIAPDGRAQLIQHGPNALGTTLAMAAVLLAGLSLNGSRRRQILCLAGGSVVIIGLILTWSRGAWLAAILGLGVLVATTPARRLGPRLLALAAVTAAASPFLVAQWTYNTERFGESLGVDNPLSRLAIWRVVPRIVSDYPVLGTGLSTFGHAYARHVPPPPGLGPPPHAHNIFLNFAAETGVLGLTAFLAFLAVATGNLWRWHTRSGPGSPARTMSAIVIAMFATLMGHQLVDGTVLGSSVGFGFYALIALGAVADQTQET